MNLNTSILKYIEDVKSGEFTVEEFTAATLQRIKDVDEDVHAYLSLNDSAINDAKKIDQKISSGEKIGQCYGCLLYTSPSPRDLSTSRMPSSA